MRQTWLLPNQRILWLSMVLPAIALGGAVAGVVWTWSENWNAFRIVSVIVGLVAAWSMLLLWRAIRTPRLAYEDGNLLVYLRSGTPIRVPIDVVEVFFFGQAPAKIANNADETSTIVVRIAERADDWKKVDVKPALGQWCDGYITIRGTWCEPLTPDLLKELNKQLVRAHREQRKRPRVNEETSQA